MNDNEFLGYVDIHSETDRALFSMSHVRRLHVLAGVDLPFDERCYGLDQCFLTMDRYYAKPLTLKARERIRAKIVATS